MYSFQIEQAIKAAGVLHQDQLRKGAVPLPYVTHLIAVTLILRDYTSDEDTLVAALLHDTIEDTDYTERELREDFGEEVGDMVMSLTEPKFEDADKLPWLKTKKRYADQLRKAKTETVMIAAADKAHNFRTIVDEYLEDHNRYMQDFGPHIEDRIEAYQDISNAINSRLKDGIVHEFNHTFDQYKKFLYDVQESKNKIG